MRIPPPPDFRFEYWDTRRTPNHSITWLVEGLLPKGCIALLSSRPHAGALEFTAALCGAIADGLDFVGMATAKSPILWFACAHSRAETEDALRLIPPSNDDSPLRFDPMVQEYGEVGAIPLYVCYSPLQLDRQETLDEVVAYAKSFEAGLIVVDNLTACTQGGTRHDGHRARPFMRSLLEATAQCGATFLLLHHLAKFGGLTRPADHPELASGSHVLLNLESGIDKWKQRLLRLSANGSGRYPSRTHFFRVNEPGRYVSANPEDEPIPVGTVYERTLERLNNHPKTVNQLCEENGCYRVSVDMAARQLVRAGLAVHGPKRGRSFTYLLAGAQSAYDDAVRMAKRPSPNPE
ncbi:MAG: AAA family ATPase [Armatimonadetes bacterium]|nr:AAA family ATPase [Armatimonadota bacterium]